MKTIKLMDERSLYYHEVRKILAEIQLEYPIRICFAAVTGSYCSNLKNSASDFDLIICFQTDADMPKKRRESLISHKSLMRLNSDTKKVDLIMCDMKLLNQIYLDYTEHEDRLPRALEYHEKYDFSELAGNNNCQLASLVVDVVRNDMLFDESDYWRKNLDYFSKRLIIYDFLKTRYTSSRGRLNNYLVTKGEVRLRSYLTNAYEIMTMEHVLESHELPSANFLDLLEYCEESDIKTILTDYFHINKQSNLPKNQVLIDPNFKLNEYFLEKLRDIKPQLVEWYNKRRFDTFEIQFE